MERPVLIRASITCLIVGTLLALINHGSAIMAGAVDADRLTRIGLTFLVPFVVSMLSSAAALGQERGATGGDPMGVAADTRSSGGRRGRT